MLQFEFGEDDKVKCKTNGTLCQRASVQNLNCDS